MGRRNENLTAQTPEISIREIETIEDFRTCIVLQREAFSLPDLEISPLRHFIVSKNAGGFTLGAFVKDKSINGKLVGFVHHLVALRNKEVIGYSHMMAISNEFQNAGIGAKLKWAQREKAVSLRQKFIKWTFDPMQSRNAHFNLNRLGAVVRSYTENYYGTDYTMMYDSSGESLNLDSDRLFAEWELDSETVENISKGIGHVNSVEAAATIEIPANWGEIVQTDIKKARAEQMRVRREFQIAFAANLVCAGFERGEKASKYLLFEA